MILNLATSFLHSWGYLAVFVFIAVEPLGIPLPGETTLIAAALYVGSIGHLNIGVVFVVAAGAAILGDNAGYWLGLTGGQRLVPLRPPHRPRPARTHPGPLPIRPARRRGRVRRTIRQPATHLRRVFRRA